MLLAGGVVLFTGLAMSGCKDDTPTSPTKTNVMIHIEDDEIEITPSALKAGPTHFVIMNVGAIEHTFEIEEGATGSEKYNKVLAPNQTDSVDVTLTEGTWEFYDPHHKADGVDHDIEVTK
jgi:hypothetical protein